MSTPLLEVRHLVHDHAGTVRGPGAGAGAGAGARALRAVDDVSFQLFAGETLGLVGESGCGKSTLGRAVLRLIEPTQGEILLDGHPWTGLDRRSLAAQRRAMQMIFQDPLASLPPRRTVTQILREPLDWHRIGAPASRPGRILELLDQVGLTPGLAQRYPHQLSGGQRQRVGIARALAVQPRLIVADEPVAALDVSVQAQILDLLAGLQQQLGLAYLFIGHDLAAVGQLADRIAVMYLGQFVEIGPAEQVLSRPAHPYTQALIEAAPRTDPGRRRPRAPLAGEVPSALAPPPGCRFHGRCPRAMPICRSMAPRDLDIGSESQGHQSHRVRCHLHDPEIDPDRHA